MRRILLFTCFLVSCAAPQRSPSSEKPFPLPFRDQLLASEFLWPLKQTYVKNPISGSMDIPQNWDTFYRSRIAAPFCGANPGTSPKIAGEKEVKGPGGLSFVDKYAGFEDFREGQKTAVSAWVREENIQAFGLVGCGDLHKQIWQDSLATMKRPQTFTIGFDDIGESLLLSRWRSSRMTADGSAITTKYRGIRAEKEGEKKDKIKTPAWMEKILGEYKDSVAEIIPLGVNRSLVRFEEKEGSPDAAILLSSDQKLTDANSIYCLQSGCNWQITKDAIFYYGQGLINEEWKYGIMSVDQGDRKRRLVYEVSSEDGRKSYPSFILGNAEPLLYRAAFRDRIVDISLVNGKAVQTADLPILLQDAVAQGFEWVSGDDLMGIATRGTKSFLWRIRDVFGEGIYQEWQTPEQATLGYIAKDKKGRVFSVGVGEGSSVVAFALNQKDRLEKIFDAGKGDYRSELRHATAADGHQVPLLVRYRAGIKPESGKHPVILEAYGGFGISTAAREVSRKLMMVMDRGYVHVTPALRGGPEIGPREEISGLYRGRQKNYEDMQAAARYIIESGWTAKGKVFIAGASNGGLLVLRTVLAAPELFGAAYARSPVADMLRFVDLDYSGLYWARRDYGYPASDKKTFQFWLDNGPLSMAMKGQKLPPILIATALGDQNVNPAHSFKVQSALKENNTGGPFLLYTGPESWVHYATTLGQALEETSYMLTFFETFGK